MNDSSDTSCDYTAIQNINLEDSTSPDTSPKRKPFPRQDSASQHPPPSNTVSIQTSFNSTSGRDQLSDHYVALDVGVQTPRRTGSDPLIGRSGLPVSKVSPMTARTRLSRQLHQEGGKALPDLSFLRTRSLSASCILRATSPADRKSEKRKADSTITSQSDTPPPVPPRLRRRVIDTLPSSRETSPALCGGRKLGASRGVTSFGSSSSSGIDAGRSFDSQLNRLSEALDLSLLPAPQILNKCAPLPAQVALQLLQCTHCGSSDSNFEASSQKLKTSPSSVNAAVKVKNAANEKDKNDGLRRAMTSDSDQHLTLSRWPNEPVRLRRPLKSCLRQKNGSTDSSFKRSSW